MADIKLESELSNLTEVVSANDAQTDNASALMVDINQDSNIQKLLADISFFSLQQVEYLKRISSQQFGGKVIPQISPSITPELEPISEEQQSIKNKIGGVFNVGETIAKGALMGMLGDYTKYIFPIMSAFNRDKKNLDTPTSVNNIPNTETPPTIQAMPQIGNYALKIDYEESSALGTTLNAIKDSAEQQVQYLAQLVDYTTDLKNALIAQSVSEIPLAQRTPLLGAGFINEGDMAKINTAAESTGSGMGGGILGGIVNSLLAGLGLTSAYKFAQKFAQKPAGEPELPTKKSPGAPEAPTRPTGAPEAPTRPAGAPEVTAPEPKAVTPKPGTAAVAETALSDAKLLNLGRIGSGIGRAAPAIAPIMGGIEYYLDKERYDKAGYNWLSGTSQKTALDLGPGTLDTILNVVTGRGAYIDQSNMTEEQRKNLALGLSMAPGGFGGMALGMANNSAEPFNFRGALEDFILQVKTGEYEQDKIYSETDPRRALALQNSLMEFGVDRDRQRFIAGDRSILQSIMPKINPVKGPAGAPMTTSAIMIGGTVAGAPIAPETALSSTQSPIIIAPINGPAGAPASVVTNSNNTTNVYNISKDNNDSFLGLQMLGGGSGDVPGLYAFGS